METNQQNWKPTDLHISMIGPEIKDELVLEMKATNPARFKEIQDLEIDIVSDTDEIVQNDKGELALFSKGTYYPLQSGKWIIPEPVTYEKEDGTEETVYEDWDFNYYIAIDGIRFLLMIEPVNPWYNLQKTNGMYIAYGDKDVLDTWNDKIQSNKDKNYVTEHEFHLELLPEPFWGDLENANVYILSGNPGFGGNERKIDCKQAFIDAMEDNLNRDASRLIWLDSDLKEKTKDETDQYAKGKKGKDFYHPGFGFWEEKTKELREAIKEQYHLTDDIENIPLNICVIELFPYHSAKISGEMRQCAKELPSRKFADFYIEEAIKEGKWIVIARCKSDWLDRIQGLRDYKNSSNKVLLTSSQQMFLTKGNLQKEVDMDSSESPAGAPKWEDFVKACKK